MFSVTRLPRLGLLGLLLGLSGAATAAVNAVGSTAGQFAVSNGAATYTIPLTLPPGLGEMKPELSLAYSSAGGGGPLGQGWAVTGLSAITLCPKTVAQDTAYVAVSKSMAAADQRFCLDGQRLVAVSGTWGTASLEMRTEIDSFSRVRISSWSGAVPDGFVVQTKAGQTLYYGETLTSRSHNSVNAPNPAVAWYVSRAVDAVGNTITFNYMRPNVAAPNATPETLIDSIAYTGNTGVSARPVWRARNA